MSLAKLSLYFYLCHRAIVKRSHRDRKRKPNSKLYITMKRYHSILILFFLVLGTTASAYAQKIAVTRDGEEVLLHADGTWEYLDEWDRDEEPDFTFGPRPTGRSAHITINGEVRFMIVEGQLTNFQILRRRRVIYDHVMRENNDRYARLSYDYRGRLARIGNWELQYRFRDNKLEKIGPYAIKYKFSNDRVEQIGPYRIDYDFSSDRISRIGNVEIKYDFFTEMPEVRGKNPGMKIVIL
ncbi:hypothetical protein HQ43_03540 [Porphyromonas canoris]|uniref:Uncharacterized protein n=2 Tax=Porphyromonas canoris TaxID=36875 RepID=A0ABR4XMS3_9PORP|nr:hypothetical protein HQ43_03540 [Porphyromonas canoris]